MALKIYGEDLDTLALARPRPARTAGESLPGWSTCKSKGRSAIPQLRVDVDHLRAALYGITPAALTAVARRRSRTAARSLRSRWQSSIRCGDPPLTKIVRPRAFATYSSQHPPGMCRCAQVAEVHEFDGPNQIQRENGQRRIAVLGNGDGRRDMAAIIADVRRRSRRAAAAARLLYALEGTFQAQEEATLRISALSLVSLALVFIVLHSRYRSTALALIIMGSIPLALIGSVGRCGSQGSRCRSRAWSASSRSRASRRATAS